MLVSLVQKLVLLDMVTETGWFIYIPLSYDTTILLRTVGSCVESMRPVQMPGCGKEAPSETGFVDEETRLIHKKIGYSVKVLVRPVICIDMEGDPTSGLNSGEYYLFR